MDNYSGEKFLDKTFNTLYNSDEVQHTYKPGDKRHEAIRKFLDRLEKVHDSRYKITVENMYFDKYVIKEDVLREKIKKMYGDNIPENVMNQAVNEVVNGQKQSLHNWLVYLSDSSTNYPTWAKYWAFQGMLKMGNYDDGIEGYQKRSKDTEAPFVDANPEIIAKAIEAVKKVVNKDEINDEDLEKIIKIGSFAKLYTILEKRCVKEAIEYSGTEGKWVKYNQGSKEDAKKLSESLQGKNTHWCTASEETAILQVCGPYGYAKEGGDFYVYYSKDKNDNYTFPRIAIRMKNNDSIGEIRGVENGQNLEEDLIPILEEKLRSMEFVSKKDIENNLSILNDLKELTKFYKSSVKNEDLSEEELTNLYSKKYGFGYIQDPRVPKIIQKRNTVEDFNSIKDESVKIAMIFRGLLPKNSISDKNIMYLCFNSKPEITKKVNDILFYDDEKAYASIQSRANIIEYATEELRNDESFIRKVINYEPWVYNYISEELKNDEDIIEQVLDNDLDTFRIIPYKYRNDKELVTEIVECRPYLFKYISDNLKKDEDVIRAALSNPDDYTNEGITRYASDEITDIDLITFMYQKDIEGRVFLKEKYKNIPGIKEIFYSIDHMYDDDECFRSYPFGLN